MDGKEKVIGLGEQLLAPGIQRVALPVVGYIAILFFLIQGPLFFPQQWAHWQTVIIVYALFLLPALILSLMNVARFSMPAWRVLVWFAVALGGGLVLFKLMLSGFKYPTGFPTGGLVAVALLQLFVITYSEESFFRGFLLELGKSRAGIGVLVSALMFSVFHLAAYSLQGLNFVAFVIAFVMGLAFGFMYIATRDYANIGIVWGLHAAFNLVLLFG